MSWARGCIECPGDGFIFGEGGYCLGWSGRIRDGSKSMIKFGDSRVSMVLRARGVLMPALVCKIRVDGIESDGSLCSDYLGVAVCRMNCGSAGIIFVGSGVVFDLFILCASSCEFDCCIVDVYKRIERL